MIVGHIGAGASGVDTGDIQKSLRFAASRSTYLSRTDTNNSTSQRATFSCWLKRGDITGNIRALHTITYDVNNRYLLSIEASGGVAFYGISSGVITYYKISGNLLRDPSSHFHLVVVYDSTLATAEDRIKLFVNGSRITSFPTTNANPAQNAIIWQSNTLWAHRVGQDAISGYYLDGYLSRVCFVDGQALTPDSFGYFNTEINEWVTKSQSAIKAVVDAGGVNSFMLDFDNGTSLTTLGHDKSTKGNNWTLNGHSLTAGVNYDWMDDVPGNNFAVLNAVHAGRSTLTNGNLTASGATDLPTIIPDYGTWYFERGGAAQTWTPPAAFPAGAGDYNFGQRPWQSTGPTGGQKALCTKNLPTPSITNPKKHFDVVLATGANIKITSEAVFPGNFFEWIKDRANSNNHQLIDTVRGSSAVLQSNTTGAETTYAAPAGSSVGWLWKAGGAPVTNNAGSISSQVSANQQAGFSIVTYTGTGANGTVGHGLGVAPMMIIIKRRNAVTNWPVYHANQGTVGLGVTYLNLADASANNATFWNSTAPTSSVFSLGTSTVPNANTGTYVAYCFAEIPGFSRIGSYTGNGSADGPFVWCGFKPRFVMIKMSSGTTHWLIKDAARNPTNEVNNNILASSANVENEATIVGSQDLNEIDFTATGFKLRDTHGYTNANGGTYIFLAFAEAPFNYANAR